AGTTVVATETNGCTLASGESIVVESGGAIEIDQGPFFGDPGLAGVVVPSNVTASSIEVAGSVSVGNTATRRGINVKEDASVSGDITISGTVEAQGTSGVIAVSVTGSVDGEIKVLAPGRLDAIGTGSRYGIQTETATAAPNIVVGAGAEVRGESRAIRLLNPMESLTNAGKIAESALAPTPAGGGIELYADLTTLTNENGGLIQGVSAGAFPVSAVSLTDATSIGTLDNSGEVNAMGGGSGIYMNALSTITALNNNAQISGSGPETATNDPTLDGVTVDGGVISTLTNSGVISGNDAAIEVEIGGFYYPAAGRINKLVNLGSLEGGVSTDGTTDPLAPAIKAFVPGSGDPAPIDRLVNKQSDLRYSGGLPSNYDVVITDASAYGSLIVDNAGGVMAFGIDVARSSVTDNTLYPGVLDGVTAEQLSATSGTSGALSWTLTQEDASTQWDLCVGDCSVSREPKPMPDPEPTPVPVMGIWALGLLTSLSGLLGVVGIRRLRRQRSV
ncbi:MAG: hypothetical protein RI542_08825, partial [Wenzhouxiangella sp.]|nr:hypothetical protein [Wenzhouxiangella sp.]